MLLTLCLSILLQISGPPASPQPGSASRNGGETRKNISRSAAESLVIRRFNALVQAMQEFSAVYNGSHVVNARKAEAVRRAWKQLEEAESQYRASTGSR